MKIGIDIDGVITNRERFLVDYGAKYCFDNDIAKGFNPLGYDVTDMYGLTRSEYEDFLNQYLELYAITEKPRPFVAEVFKKLKMDGHELIIIASRNRADKRNEVGENMRFLVKRWLMEHGIQYDKIIFSSENKLKSCANNKIEIMIEDKAETINELSKVMKVICFDANCNKECINENIIRCYSWYDIYDKINML